MYDTAHIAVAMRGVPLFEAETAPSCSEKSALLEAYSKAAKDYGKIVSELNELMGLVTRAEWLRLHKIADELRLSVESSRQALDAHIAKHGC